MNSRIFSPIFRHISRENVRPETFRAGAQRYKDQPLNVSVNQFARMMDAVERKKIEKRVPYFRASI